MVETVIVLPTFDVAHTHRQCRATGNAADMIKQYDEAA